MAIFKFRDRAKRSAFKAAHAAAMKSAQECYDLCSHEKLVHREYEDGPFHVYTVAPPYREAWDTYFAHMRQLGEDGWKGKKLFDKELKQ
ncbi:hypothetical protein SEA_ZOOMAN_189 [Microbacterium phage Zooman]|nr:hypothetical protein SEA_ZOOMAN_189 [Microbacterium phage Zooman]